MGFQISSRVGEANSAFFYTKLQRQGRRNERNDFSLSAPPRSCQSHITSARAELPAPRCESRKSCGNLVESRLYCDTRKMILVPQPLEAYARTSVDNAHPT